MSTTLAKEIPLHLREFVSTQNYEDYTPSDHAVWRYVMRQNHAFLEDRAHPAFVKGLKGSGIAIEKIPEVSEMNEALGKIGWGAVIVDGLIPGTAFFDLQAHGILPIATDIRKVSNIEYTPAPDILHEAAGHAPILFDSTYSAFVKKIGAAGAKAFATKKEHEAFEAVRILTIVKESPDSTKEEILEAERNVREKQALVEQDSEAEQISRLFWWTVEFGLIGELEKPMVYGAGLLSSVGESKACLSDKVRKIPFSIEECIKTSYDVTTMQKQLFVCKSFEELIQAVEEFSASMAYRTGGASAVQKAIKSEKLATVEFNSGLQVSGVFSEMMKNEEGEPTFIRTTGETALAVHNRELKGHSKMTHPDGFGAPVGPLEGDVFLETLSQDEMRHAGVEIGNEVHLTFKSGITLEGGITGIIREDGKTILLSFTNCTVKQRDEILFHPSWGPFDLPVGSSIRSAYPGAADHSSFLSDENPEVETASANTELGELEILYQAVREIRENGLGAEPETRRLQEIAAELRAHHHDEWLLRLEILELLIESGLLPEEAGELQDELVHLAETPQFKRLIENGLALIPAAVQEVSS
ncbi:aromatic amino acid hydroxylase [Bacillus salacetis]|uniref:Aromatic amino acid hydroxylase n=1 Tax=Bacillus salacetis TaxID=2315464 RepID=A0A3A1QWE6_9BACI|nr:aromatic amino acid hydroxylase [Bacillus salacetis]RIW32687.1 aromatic amino acid hydroxylase [Bacillus salacetis]